MGTLRSVGIRVPVGAPGPGLLRGARPVASVPAPVLPRASAASTAVEQRGPGHRAPCGVIFRQARHTRSPWVSSHASVGAAPVDRCTERRWDTKDCRQLHPVGEAPSRRAHRGMGQNHHLMGGWRLWFRAGAGRCWVGMGASPVRPPRARPFPWGPSWGAGHPAYLLAGPHVLVQGRFPSGPLGGGGLWGVSRVPLHVPAYRSRVGRQRCHRAVPWGRTLRGRSCLRRGARA